MDNARNIRLGLFAAVMLLGLCLAMNMGPAGLYKDDAGCLFAGKYFLTDPASVFALHSPETLNSQPHFNRILWIYYRPVERIAWALCFFFFGASSILIGLAQKVIFFVSIFLIYKIACLLLDRVAGLIAICVFILVPLVYGLLAWNTWLAAQLGLLFLLAGAYASFKGFMRQRPFLVFCGVIFIYLASLCRESNFYIYSGVMLFYALDYLRYQEKTSRLNRCWIIVLSALLLGSLFYGYLFFKTPVYNTALWEQHLPRQNSFIVNSNLYLTEIAKNISPFLIIICVYLFFVYRSSLQFIGMVWALVSLVPLFFMGNAAKTYLYDFFTGLSLFCAGGLAPLLKEAYQKGVPAKQYPLFAVKVLFQKKKWQPAVLVIAIFFLLLNGFKSLVTIIDDAQYPRLKKIIREQRLDYLKNSKYGEEIFVPSFPAKEFYDSLAATIGRKDLKIKAIANRVDLKDFIIGGNLLKNSGFEKQLEHWLLFSARPELMEMSGECSLEGKHSLLIDGQKLQGLTFNLVDMAQLFRVEPGQHYIFGGMVKLDRLRDGVRFEICERNGRGGVWQTNSKKSICDWQILFNYFTPGEEEREFFFYAARSENLIRGKAYIDQVFVYQVKQPILGYD